ncbi:MAG: N-acetylglucosamine-6-phosphate deacetylase [Caldilineaceae bacterium]
MAARNTLHIRGGEIPELFAQSGAGVPTASLTPGFRHSEVMIQDGRIAAVEPSLDGAPVPVLDARECLVLPGFIDVHVHGAVGYDTMDASQTGLSEMAEFYAQHGVTGFLPTTMTAPHSDTLAAVINVAQCDPLPLCGARILGVHLEGPYISPAFPGAQKSENIREPSIAEFATLAEAGPVRMITLAPEQPGAHELIREARRRGVVAVAGHTNASYDELEAAVQIGVSQATHTYNAMSGLHHRRPGTLGAVLSDDRIYAQLIADNIHVHPAAMRILNRCKSVARTVLITDAIRATGMEPGYYDLGGQSVTVADGACRLNDGTLAGSVLTLEIGLANFAAAAGLSLGESWPAAGRSPAASLGLGEEFGSIEPGYWGDLTVLDHELGVVATVVAGNVVYLRDEARLT